MRPEHKTALIGDSPEPVQPVAQKEAHKTAKQRGVGGPGSMLVALTAIALLAYGWLGRSERIIDSETGLGYWLGIAGLTSVGLLLIYPFRKRIPVLRAIGTVPFWFSTHMLLGVAGPILILYHSNFSLGSLNSTIALFSMLIVAASGVVGRFLYVRIHRDMAGRKAEARTIIASAALQRQSLQQMFGMHQDWIDDLEDVEERLQTRPASVFHATWRAMMVSNAVTATQKAMRKQMRKAVASVSRKDRSRRSKLKKRAKEIGRTIDAYSRTVKDASRLSVYERLFALWHVFHLPLFFLMLIAAIIHVVAVHLY